MNYHNAIFNTLHYCLVTTKKESKKVIKDFKLGKDSLPNDITSNGYAYYDPNSRVVVVKLINLELDYISTLGLIIHEAVHVKQYILEQINESNPSEEFEAYLLQEISENLIRDFINKK